MSRSALILVAVAVAALIAQRGQAAAITCQAMPESQIGQLPAPAGFSGIAEAESGHVFVRLTWTDLSDGESCFVIETREGPPDPPAFRLMGSALPDSEECADLGPFGVFNLQYRIYAVADGVRSPYSPIAEVTIPADIATAGPAPPGLNRCDVGILQPSTAPTVTPTSSTPAPSVSPSTGTASVTPVQLPVTGGQQSGSGMPTLSLGLAMLAGSLIVAAVVALSWRIARPH